MQILILVLLIAALALLVLALVGSNPALAACSIALSLIAVAVIVRGRQRRAELAQAKLAEAERLARIEADQDEATRVLAAAAAAAGRRAAAASPAAEAAVPPTSAAAGVERAPAVTPAEPVAGATALPSPPAEGEDESLADEPPAADTVAPLDRHGQGRVWVIDGHPRYHLTECRHLDGTAEPISLGQAVQDGFTPCAACDPDNRIT